MSSASSQLSPAEVKSLKESGKKAHAEGRFRDAIEDQIKVVNHYAATGEPSPDESKLLCLYFYSIKDYPAAAQVLEFLKSKFPDDPENFENLGVVLRKMGKTREAIVELEKAVEMDPEKSNIHDALAHSYGQIKEPEKCQKHGRLSLEIKDRESLGQGVRHPVPEEKPKPFSFDGNNVIAFSLWGENPRYLTGAIRNAQLIPDLYHGWSCRVYHDKSVPGETLKQLEEHGVRLTKMEPPKNFYDGLFWRFIPATDPKVDRFLIRDIDSVVNVKERAAVGQWLESEKYFHVMRDFCSHTELILAGMWGGVGGVLPKLNQLLKEFKPKTKATETYDQLFLRLAVWPTISQSVMIHDSVFEALGSIPYPDWAKLPPNRHVGQNEAASRKPAKPVAGK